MLCIKNVACFYVLLTKFLLSPAKVCIGSKGKGKAIPLQALEDPVGSRKLRLPDFKTIGK
jgi:hypothetical protein